MKYFIEDFIEETNKSTTRKEAFDCYQKAINALGFDSAVYTFVTDHPSVHQEAGHGIQCNFPKDWMQHYITNDYQAIDPVIMRVKRSPLPFRWRDLLESGCLSEEQKRILHEAADAGLNEGVGIPLYGPQRELAGVGISTTVTDHQIDDNILSKLQLISHQFHTVYCALNVQVQKPPKPLLGSKQSEILKWYAVGKTRDEIAMIMGCSPDTVKTQTRLIFDKLAVNNKIFAVTKAIRMGILEVDVLSSTVEN